MLLAVLLLAACSEDPEPVEACDAQCRIDGVKAAWAEDPDNGAAALAALPSPEERMLVTRALLYAGQVRDGRLCRELTDPSTRAYCEKLAQRPHLFEPPRPQTRTRRAAGGPADTELLPLTPAHTAMADVPEADLSRCREGEAGSSCAARLAEAAAREGMLDPAASRCNAIEAEKLRWECRFSAAEQAVRRHGVKVLEPAVDLCLVSGDYTAHCLAHLADRLGERAPAATEDSGWAPIAEAAARFAAAVGTADPTLAPLAESRVWSVATAESWRRAPHVDGRPLDHLPEAAAPHARAALAYELVMREPALADGSLDDFVARIEATEAARGAVAGPVERPPHRSVRNRWGADDVHSERFAATWWRGLARRPTHDDPAVDRALCALEAAAAAGGVDAAILHQGLSHPEPVVAWSAGRLSGRPGEVARAGRR